MIVMEVQSAGRFLQGAIKDVSYSELGEKERERKNAREKNSRDGGRIGTVDKIKQKLRPFRALPLRRMSYENANRPIFNILQSPYAKPSVFTYGTQGSKGTYL